MQFGVVSGSDARTSASSAEALRPRSPGRSSWPEGCCGFARESGRRNSLRRRSRLRRVGSIELAAEYRWWIEVIHVVRGERDALPISSQRDATEEELVLTAFRVERSL